MRAESSNGSERIQVVFDDLTIIANPRVRLDGLPAPPGRMNILIRRKAADDLEWISLSIAEDNPTAAFAVARRLRDRIAWLATSGLEHTMTVGYDSRKSTPTLFLREA